MQYKQLKRQALFYLDKVQEIINTHVKYDEKNCSKSHKVKVDKAINELRAKINGIKREDVR